MAVLPHVPWTADQRKKLCCLLRERGLWEDRHEVCRVKSLADLTRDQAAACIKRLADDEPDRGYRYPPRAPTLGASKAKRDYVRRLGRDLEWDWVKLRGWLHSHAGIADLDATYLAPVAARSAIDQLVNILEKEAAARGWYFRRTRFGHVLNKNQPQIAQTDTDSYPPHSDPCSSASSVASPLF